MSEAGTADAERVETARRVTRAGLDPAECLAGGGQMGALMRSMDWARTPLGPVTKWPQSLRTSVSICLGTSFPMMIAWGSELHMLYNDGYLPVLGSKKHPQALAQPLLECFAEIRELLGKMFGGVMESGEPIGANDMMFPIERHGYPEETYFVFSYSPIRDESGRVGGVLTTCTETTARVIGERRLRTLRALAEGAVHAQSAEDAFDRAAKTLDPADTPFALLYLVDASAGSARLVSTCGIPAESPACLATVDLGDSATPWPLRECASTRIPQIVEALGDRFGPLPGGPWPEPTSQAVVLPIARPGQVHPYGFLVAGVSPRRALDDAYRGYLELVADHIATAVANARAREEERKRNEALAELDRAKTTFFSNVSHEFRTPLTLMLAPIEDLLAGAHGELRSPVREQLDLTHRNALRLLKLVNSLLDFARIEAGRMRALYQPIDLAAVTTDIASSFRSAVERAGLRFSVDCVRLPEPVYVDVEMWEKIVLNLLSNALKFTFEGEIAVHLRRNGELVELEVRDTGSGIPQSELPNLFKRFHRIQGTKSRTHEGTGIGLALVLDLLRLHGGDIRCESEPGRGSVFTATIRTGSAHLPGDQIGVPHSETSSVARSEAFVAEALRWLPESSHFEHVPDAGERDEAPRGIAAGARILVADDNADMRNYLRRILGAHWRVEAVADGQVALESARRDPPDLVLADVMMPGLDGFGLLRELRAGERTRSVPVVMLSARAGEEARIEGLDAGADDYLVKPFSARELVARVNSQLALATARRAIEEQRSTLYTVFKHIPASISVIRGSDFVYEMANDQSLALADTQPHELIGRPAFEVFPELRGQGFEEMILSVMRSGRPFVGKEVPLAFDLDHDGVKETTYWNLVLTPLPDERGRTDCVMSFSYDVTAQVRARREIETIAADLQQTVAQLDTILATVPVGLAFWDRDLRYTRINENLAQLNGVSVEQTLRRTAAEILPPDLAAIAEKNIRRVLESRTSVGPIELSAPAPRCPGELRHWLATYYPVLDPEGEVKRVGVVVVDVTVQKNAELERSALLEREQLARKEADLQREHLHSLFMQAPTPICILRGPRYVIELANHLCCEVWGRRHEDVIARPLFEALPEVESQVFNELLGGVLSTGDPHIGKEVRAELGSNGHRRSVYFNFVYAPLRDASGRVDGVLVVAFDVTDEVRARDEMSRTLRYNEMFAGILGHDLRNPLGSIMTAAQLVLRRASDERFATPATRILESGERMSRMIEQLLDFTRIRIGGGLTLERRLVDAAELVRRVVAEVEAGADRSKFQLKSTGDTEGEWDADRLSQVFSNLAGNAAQHGAKARPVRVHVDGRDAEAITIEFSNEGQITESLLPNLFEPFRGTENKRTNANGLGLGLFISKQIVVAHGGAIHASSRDGETRFAVVLPRSSGRRLKAVP